jgi:hypothetical protein
VRIGNKCITFLIVFEPSIAPFRAALREQLKRPDEPLSDSLQGAVQTLAELARAQGTLAEQFVIFIKREWELAVYDELLGGDVSRHQRVRQSLVTAAIKAYYLQ